MHSPGLISLLISAAGVPALLGQATKAQPKPVQEQATSSITTSTEKDGAQTVEIRNVSFEATWPQVPGRPRDERLLLRKTIHSKTTLGDIGVDATVTLEAWRLGDDLRQKPRYAISIPGTEGHTLDNAIFIVSRGLEEVDWWSVYKLGSGQHMFDTYVPLLSFSISRDIVNTRYVGLEVPPDDTADPRLKQPNVVGVLTYASEDRVIREVLITCEDRNQAAQLRSYADETRTLSLVERPSTTPATGQAAEPLRSLKVSFGESYPSAPNTIEVVIPLAAGDLDLAHAQLPPKLRVASWRR